VDLRVDLVVQGLVSVASSLLRCKSRALLLRQPDTFTVWDLVLDAAVQRIIDDFVEVDETLHTAFCLGLLWFLALLLPRILEHSPVFLCVLLQLLVKCAHLLLRLQGLGCLQLVDIANETVFLGLFSAFVRYALFHDSFKIAVKEVKPGHIVPRMQFIPRKDDHFVLAKDLFELLDALACGSSMSFRLSIHGGRCPILLLLVQVHLESANEAVFRY